MKYCLKYWQKQNLLEEADEIKVSFKDRKILPELFEKYPTKTFILSLFPRKELEIDWKELINFNILSRDKLIIEGFEPWEIIKAIENKIILDFKTKLQEHLQKNGEVNITYELVKFEGPPHRRKFFTKVLINGECMGEGEGFSKKEAEQASAKQALKKMGVINE